MTMIKEEPNIFQKSACSVAGAYSAVVLKNLVKNNNPLSAKALEAINAVPALSAKQTDAFINTLTNNKHLKNSDFKMLYVTDKNLNKVNDILVNKTIEQLKKIFDFNQLKEQKEMFQNSIKTALSGKLKRVITDVGNGKNAFYYPFTNVAVYPKGKTIMLAHEIGHAINANSSKFATGLISASRILPKVALITLPAVAIWKSFKNKNSEDKSFVQKHAGKMVFTSFVPMLAEEALASLRAIKATQKINLSKNLIKDMKKGYGFALSTYFTIAIAASLATALATKLFSKKNKD